MQLETNIVVLQKREAKEVARRKQLTAELAAVKQELIGQDTLATAIATCVSQVEELVSMGAKHLVGMFAVETFLSDQKLPLRAPDLLQMLKDYIVKVDSTLKEFQGLLPKIVSLDKLTLSSRNAQPEVKPEVKPEPSRSRSEESRDDEDLGGKSPPKSAVVRGVAPRQATAPASSAASKAAGKRPVSDPERQPDPVQPMV